MTLHLRLTVLLSRAYHAHAPDRLDRCDVAASTSLKAVLSIRFVRARRRVMRRPFGFYEPK
jgi:hypothetical protein